jgi:multidrug resistance protein, MATE family
MIESETIQQEQPAADMTVRPGMQGRVLRLAWPVIGENMLQTLLGVVDTLLVAQLGAAAIAGVGTGLQLTFFLISALSAVTIGASILVAHAAGARDGQGANRLARQSLLWGVAISVPLSIAAVALGDPLIGVFGVTPEVAEIGAGFWRIVAGGSVLLMLMLTCSAILRGLGDSRTPMLATLLANVVNAVAAYGLIFGAWGLPALGTDGSAWASNLGRLVGAIMLLAVLIKGRGLVTLRGRLGWRPDLSVARRIFQLGVPAASEQVLTTLSFLTLTIVIASLGTDVLAAQRLAFTAMSFAFLPGFGFAIAATALVGQSLGARRPAEAAAVAGIATRWAVIWMGALAVVFFFFGAQIMRLFSDDPAVITFGADSLRVIALSQPFWAVMFVQAGALRGARDTTFPLRVNTLGMWAAVGLAWLAVSVFHLGLVAAWGAYAVVAPAMAFLLWRRFRRGDWQQTPPTPGAVPVAAVAEM